MEIVDENQKQNNANVNRIYKNEKHFDRKNRQFSYSPDKIVTSSLIIVLNLYGFKFLRGQYFDEKRQQQQQKYTELQTVKQQLRSYTSTR